MAHCSKGKTAFTALILKAPKQTLGQCSSWARQHAAIFFALILIAAIAWAINIAIDPYVAFSSPLGVQWPNALIPILLALTLYALTNRPAFSLVLTTLLQLALYWGDSTKLRLLNSHLVYADFIAAPTLLKDPTLASDFVRTSVPSLYFLFMLSMASLWLSWRRFSLFNLTLSQRLCIALSSPAIVLILFMPKSPIPLPASSWNPFDEGNQSPTIGVVGNILRGARSYGRLPQVIDPSAITPLLNLSGSLQPTTHLQPDIVIVQSESLFEPSILCEMPNEPYLKDISVFSSQVSSLIPPTFGGRTLQTEFEAISGIPTKPFGSQFSYIDLLKQPIESLASTLDQAGYQTIVIHPNLRTYWRRDFAMRMLGFDTFLDVEAFSDRDVGKWGRVSDQSLMEAALSEIESSSKPTMTFLITIQNHGPWGAVNIANTSANTELKDYISRAVEADKAWAYLITSLSHRRRPTLAVLYGDHMPALASTFEKRCFINGLHAEQQSPPVAVWANFPLPKLPKAIHSYELPGWILNASQLPSSNFFSISAHLPRLYETRSKDEMKSILEGYYALASQQLSRGRASRHTYRLSQHVVSNLLPTMLIRGQIDSTVPQDILFKHSAEDESAIINLNNVVDSITLRAYPVDPKCRSEQKISVYGDGVRRATMISMGKTNFSTLSTEQVSRLTITVHPIHNQVSGDRCGLLSLRVIEMQCTTANCGPR
ncbi:LTA synthase family protein [Xanthomonas euvesicatoria]|uniref:LTA synthase family protein n=1 Tax=Xanthomonas euvesicatoria TaxID=456327 RepID=UPI0024056A17|nr:LTA synthase family protein [Xanthomonas euvesicatoria]MCP3043456.1 LTA synthase family protein [Xanthomonas euvesicatoria pv. allii]